MSRFPLIYLDETILAHTNLAEFHKFLQEKENEALLDRMVIVKVPYTLVVSATRRASTASSCPRAPAFREVHLDPHVAAISRPCICSSHASAEARARRPRSARRSSSSTRARSVEGFPATDVPRMRAESPEEGLTGVEPALRRQLDHRTPSRATTSRA